MSLLASRGALVAVAQGECASPAEAKASALLDAALRYAREGWAVLPLHSSGNGDCTCRRSSRRRGEDGRCREAGKHPRTRHGVKDATRDEDTIRAWWKKWPDANIGGATGRASNVVVIDVDRHGEVDGPARLAWLEAEYGELPATRTHRTGGGGEHRIFRYAVGVRSRHLGGVDLLSDGGYVVLPPSVHRSGDLYEIDDGRAEVLLPIGWRRAFGKEASGLPRWLPASIEVGRRDVTLFRLACYLRRYGANAQKIHEVLRQVTAERVVQPLGNEVSGERLQQIAFDVERKYEPTDIVPLFSRWDEIARSWNDRCAATDRRVLEAIIDVAKGRHAKGLNPFDLELPVRPLAERAAMAKETVSRSLARLAGQRGLLVRLHHYSETFYPNGTVYRFLQPEDVSSGIHTPRKPGESGRSSVCRRKHHDLFRKGGMALGWLAGDVYWLLDAARPVRLRDLSARLKRQRGSVLKALRRLERHDLANAQGDEWLLGPAEPDTVALALGVAGRAEKQKAIHSAQRKVFDSEESRTARRRRAAERRVLAAEVLACAVEAAYLALPSGLVGTGADTWSTWAKTANRKDLTAALVELRAVRRSTVRGGTAWRRVVDDGSSLFATAGREPRRRCAPATRAGRVDRKGGATARNAPHGRWARSVPTFVTLPGKMTERSSALTVPTYAAAS